MLRGLIMVLLLAAGPLHAGAWPRGKGGLFASALSYTAGGQTYSGIYAEYGVTDRLTLGLDLGRGVSGNTKAVAFFRLPMMAPINGHNLAWELGAGQIAGHSVLRPGLSWGKGVSLGGKSGWLSADILSELWLGSWQADHKIDLTFGLNVTERHKAMVQLQAGAQWGDAPFLRVVPSIVFDVGEITKFEIGVTQSLRGDYETGVKLALWMTF